MGKTKNRQRKAVLRDNSIHLAYRALMNRGGDFAKAVSRRFIYESLSRETGYSTRWIANILNHTDYIDPASIEE